MNASTNEYPIVVKYTPPASAGQQGTFLLEPAEGSEKCSFVAFDAATGDITVTPPNGSDTEAISIRFDLAADDRCGFAGIKFWGLQETPPVQYHKSSEGKIAGTPFEVSALTDSKTGHERTTQISVRNHCTELGSFYYCFAVHKDLTSANGSSDIDEFDPRITNNGDTGG